MRKYEFFSYGFECILFKEALCQVLTENDVSNGSFCPTFEHSCWSFSLRSETRRTIERNSFQIPARVKTDPISDIWTSSYFSIFSLVLVLTDRADISTSISSKILPCALCFNSILVVWKRGQSQTFVFDIFLNTILVSFWRRCWWMQGSRNLSSKLHL